MNEHPPLSPEDAATVAEYALGLLPEAEAREFAQRLKGEASLRAALAAWQNDLATLTDDIEPVQPPAKTKSALDQRLFPETAKPGFWSRVGLWRGWAVAATLAAAFFYFQPADTPKGPFFATEISSKNAVLQITALFNPADSSLSLNRTQGGALPDRDLELWIITKGKAPVSLGVLANASNSQHIIPPALVALLPGATLAISDEPLGGSPTGQPTGQVLAAGNLVQL